MRFRFLTTLICTAGFVIVPNAASAATITVETKDDDSVTECSLRDAIDAANTNAASGDCPAGQGSPIVDTINFAVTPGAPPITLGSALPVITSSLNVVGPGASQLTISGGDAVRVLQINSGTVTISGLTIADGFCDSTCDDGAVGAGILNNSALTLSGVTVSDNEVRSSDPTNAFSEGGGIYNQGTLTIVNSDVNDNRATTSGASNQNGASGAGIRNHGTVTLDRSTVSGNVSSADGGGGSSANATAGGISNFGTFNITRSTVSGNTATATGGSSNNQARGGAVSQANSPAAHLNVTRSTVSGNLAVASGTNPTETGGGLTGGADDTITVTGSTITGNSAASAANLQTGTASTYKSTIVSNPQGGGVNCGFGGVDSQGYNLEELTGTCGFGEPTDHPNSLPAGLDPNLADNGGPTQTHALLAGSLAIDKGFGSCTTDQRGQPSPSDVNGVANAAGGNGTDIGAYERQDTNPPGTTITSGLANGAQTKSRSQTFGFTATEACSTFQCRVDAASFSACKSPHTTASLADGGHTFSVRALDGGHHADASPAARTFTIDNTGPVTEITKAPKKKVKTRKKRKKAKFEFSSTEAPSSFECSLDDAGFEPCVSPFKAKVKKGKHTFEVRASDSLSNVGPPDAHKWKVKRKRR